MLLFSWAVKLTGYRFYGIPELMKIAKGRFNMQIPTPYTGKDKYIFISYSHRDTYYAFSIISELIKNGYRVWFDGGIDPGTEWDENIASHINECGYFIALMSNNYLNSSNCKDELNYARDLEKERLIVYLEDVELPAGMAMRINRLQSIFKFTYANEQDFYKKLFTAKNIEVCHGGRTQYQQATPQQQVPPRQTPPVRQAPPRQTTPIQPKKSNAEDSKPSFKNWEEKNKGAIACVMACIFLGVAFGRTDYRVVLPLLVISIAFATYTIWVEKRKGIRRFANVLYFYDGLAISGFVEEAIVVPEPGTGLIVGMIIFIILFIIMRNKRDKSKATK